MRDKRIKEDCPFCGEKAENIQIRELIRGSNQIYCPTCQAGFNIIDSKVKLINLWNMRYKSDNRQN